MSNRIYDHELVGRSVKTTRGIIEIRSLRAWMGSETEITRTYIQLTGPAADCVVFFGADQYAKGSSLETSYGKVWFNEPRLRPVLERLLA